MPTYQITTDKGVYKVDTQSGQDNSSPTPVSSGSNVTSDLQQASDALGSFAPSQSQAQAPNQPPMSPGDKAVSLLGQFGKGVYSNPIIHPALKALGDWAGANPDQAYAGVGDPNTIGEKVASGLGSAAPLMAVAGPMGAGVDALAGGAATVARGIPILGKMTQFLKDSQLAKSALTGFGYGAAEAKAANMQGQQMDVGQNAMNTAGQFLFWSALSKGGANAASKLISPDLLKQPGALKNLPIIGNATKAAFTPEGLGSIAGGALAGALNAPDNKSGIAGAIVGASLSAMNPMEQFQFRKGMGKSIGFKGISAITDHFGKPFAEANDIFENFGFDDVAKAGTQQIQKPNNVGGVDTLSTPQIVYDSHQQAMGAIKQQRSVAFDDALQKNESINPKNIGSFLSLLRQRVSEIQDPTSPVVRQFNKTYDALKGFQSTYTDTEIPGTKEQPNAAGLNPRQVTMSQLPPQLREKVMQQMGAQDERQNSSLSLNALHQLKMAMQDMVSPQVWAGDRAMSPEERDANGIAQQIAGYIGRNNEAYQKASSDYAMFKKIQGKVYDLDPKKLSQNMLTFEDTNRNLRENDLNQISDYLQKNGQEKFDSRNLLKKYYAYQIYNNPTSAGFAKSYAVREVSAASLAALFHFTGIPGGGLLGGLAGWNMSNPAAWLPALKGASESKNAKVLASIISRRTPAKSP